MEEKHSPELIRFKKPSGVIKLKIKKKKLTQNSSKRISNALKPINGRIQDGRSQALKRANPFKCSPRKKANLSAKEKTSECRLFSALDGLDENQENRFTNTVHETSNNSQQQNTGNSLETDVADSPLTVAKEKIGENDGSEFFPLDWSLKTKVRFSSSKTFNWCGTLKTFDEGAGMSHFVRCQTKEIDSNGNGASHPESFCSFTKVWMHPSLPWLELFPRKSADGRTSSKRHFLITEEMASSLHHDWVSSFRSVFNMVRVGFCPYFYLVANQNTMLFQAAGINRDDAVQVVITPTTKGFRDALRSEGKSTSLYRFMNIGRNFLKKLWCCDIPLTKGYSSKRQLLNSLRWPIYVINSVDNT